MPLFGKLVVIKRNGADGTEFPLTASCLFGRKLDCDIRIQMPQVSKEHCRIELNENKELILTNLSSVNPTLINGEILQQSERLKHGDLITVIDRSFRFEYPPAPTPKKKRLSTPGKGDAVKVLQDQQIRSTPGTTEKKKTEHSADTCLKDGSNLPACLDQSVGEQQNKASLDSTMSPFSDLYNMVKQDLANKPVWKSANLSNTPLSRSSVDTPELEKVSSENDKPVTPKSAQKKRRSSTTKPSEGAQTNSLPAQVKTTTPVIQKEQCTPVSQKKTPQKFTADQVVQQIAFESPSIKSSKGRRSSASQTPESQTTSQQIAIQSLSTKSPKARRSSTSQTPEKLTASQNPSESAEAAESKAKQATRTSPRTSAGNLLQVLDVLREVVTTPTSKVKAGNGQASSKKHICDDLPLPAAKRKRVSFGGQLSPELFDKRLPPNSPLRRGATPGRRSLGFSQKPYSLLRRASTIGLMGYQLEEDIAESPAKNASPKRVASPAKKAAKTPSPAKKAAKTPSPAKKAAKTPSPAKKAAKTPSPAKKAAKTPSPAKKAAKTPSPAKKAAKTPSPAKKAAKTPSPAKKAAKTPSPAKKAAKTPSPAKKSPPSKPPTPKSSRRLSNASANSPSPSEESLLKTPTMRGRFSVSRISTPSPVQEESVPIVQEPQEGMTLKATPRRISMKVSARKTPKSMLKSALEVVRSRRSGASRANLKVVSSWADIVKFGQAKLQMEGTTKNAVTKRTTVKQAKVTKLKTPARRLKDHTSTGHADSPASIVVGKAYLRSTQPVCAAPKVVCNVALLKKDMKMDEDFTGVSDIFKTPANSRRKSALTKSNECPVTPLDVGEMSEVHTPEESGEMMVSPMSVASTAKRGRYNSEAVTRLLQDDQEGSSIAKMDDSTTLPSSEGSTVLDITSEDQTENKKDAPVHTPQHKPAPSECLTGVKRLMRTPKQRAEPIEDLRGKLLKTPKEVKPPQEESLEGIKELLNTPKQKGTSLEKATAGLEKVVGTPSITNSPAECAVVLKRFVKSPKDKTEQGEDLTGVKRLMKTPKQKKQPVEEDLAGIQEMMKTPKQKNLPVEEDLTGVKQMMKTSKQKNQPVEEDLTGVKQIMKTPKQKNLPVEEDLTGIQELMKTPKQTKPVEEDLTEVQQTMKAPKQKKQPVEEDLTGVKQMMKTPKQKKQPVEEDLTGVKQMMKTPKQKKQPVEEDLTGIQEMMKTPKQTKQPVEEDLTEVQQTMKTPKQKKQPVEEDLTGVKQMIKTPKQKKQPVEEDLTGVKQMMKTPKQKKQPVEEDLTGIQEMMKTPKQTKQPVEEDLTEVQQTMKTPKQKKQPVEEDLTGVMQMMKTPKQKNQPVENEFGIDNLMKTPKQKSGEAVVESTIVSELDVLPVKDVHERSEEKENICPVESVKSNIETAAGPQVEREESKISCQEFEDATVSEVMTNEDVQETPLETVCTSEMVTIVAATPAVPSKQEEQSNGSSPAKKTRCGAQEGTAHRSDIVAEPEKETSHDSVKSVSSVRGRRGRLAAELKDTPVKSPAPARAKRGRKEKHELENPQEPDILPEASVVEVVREALDSAKLQPSLETETVGNARARRGRATRKEPAEVEKMSSVQNPDAVVEVKSGIESLKSTRKNRNGRSTKKEMLKTSEPEESLENTPIVEETDVQSSDTLVVPDVVEPVLPENPNILLDVETEHPSKANTKPRRGRAAKKETPVTAKETSKASSDSEVLPEEPTQMPVVKPRRGRRVNQAAVDESNVEPPAVESEPKPEAPAVRSSRSARNKQLKPKVEDASNDPATEVIPTAAVTEEPAEPVVKNVRGGRRTKQPRAQVLDDSQEEAQVKPSIDSETIQQSEAPAARSGRGKRAAAVKDKPETQAKRGSEAATVEVPPVVKLGRGRRAAAKSKPEEVTEDATIVVEPVEETSNEPKVLESVCGSGVSLVTDSEIAIVEVVPKRGRGRIVKKTKISTKDASLNEAQEEAVEPQLKKSKNMTEPAAQDGDSSVTEAKQLVHPSVKGRKGRGANKQEEPEKEEAPEENVQPVRRGRTGASVVSQHDEVAACPKRGQKRKDMEVVAEATPDTESLPKRKRGKGAGVEAQTDVSLPGKGRRTVVKEAEETSEVETEEPLKKVDKPVRGRRKATQKDVPLQAEDPVPEPTTRRGLRGQKKAEPEVPSAPVRRTRRK